MISTHHSNKFTFRKDVSCQRFTVDNNGPLEGEELSLRKDQFIELAQAALEQAKREEKGLFHELMETFIEHTGAPMVADALLQQFKSQEVIERLAEQHCAQEKQKVKTSHLLSLQEPQNELTVETHTCNSHVWIISEYLGRLFRLLFLASLVGLVYHFMCAHSSTLIYLTR